MSRFLECPTDSRIWQPLSKIEYLRAVRISLLASQNTHPHNLDKRNQENGIDSVEEGPTTGEHEQHEI